MKISVITLFPDMISAFMKESIVARAVKKGVVEIEVINLRDFAEDKYRTVDDRPYGGGAGMVMKADVVSRAIASVKIKDTHTVLTTPKGVLYDQEKAETFSKKNHLIILAGHYEGYDERIRSLIDEEVSIGDFVLTGGELAAGVIIDSVVRLLPGALKKSEATIEESYSAVSVSRLQEVVGSHKLLDKLVSSGVELVRLLEYPHYTRPEKFEHEAVPSILLSGDHKKIEDWRLKMAFEETLKRRPDLLHPSSSTD